MFLGYVELSNTMVRHILSKAGNTPGNADSAPTFRIYGSSSTPVTTGTCTGPVDSQTGWYSLSQAVTSGNGFSRGSYTIRVAYEISSTAYADTYSFTVV